MSQRWYAISRHVGAIALLAVSTGALAADDPPPVVPIAPGNLCVTEGAIDRLPGRLLRVAVPRMRAVARTGGGQAIELRFRYLGLTAQIERIGSGEQGQQGQQLGLKLRAQDACNLVTAMWRIAPEPGLTVSVRSNPERRSAAQCGNAGTRTVTARTARPLPVLRPGDAHRLRADLAGTSLRIAVDGRVVWEGDLGERVPAEGPVGIRSDNARLELEILADAAPAGQRPAACRPGERED